MRNKISIHVILVTLLSLGVALPALAKEKKEVLERFRAHAMSLERGRATLLTITINSWTTPEERQALAQALADGGGRGLYDYLDKQEDKGYLQVPGSLGYEMRYAFQFQNEGKRQIVLGTNRPILIGEMMRGSRSTDYDISLLVLELDEAAGEGTGTLVMGAELTIDKETGKLVIETPTTPADAPDQGPRGREVTAAAGAPWGAAVDKVESSTTQRGPNGRCDSIQQGTVCASWRRSLLVAVCLSLTGCSSIGPGTIPRDRFDYGAAIADSGREQLLLNIVRLPDVAVRAAGGGSKAPFDAFVAILALPAGRDRAGSVVQARKPLHAFVRGCCRLPRSEPAQAKVAQLLDIAWETMGSIAGRLVEEQLSERRFDDLRRMGVDEMSYR